MIFILVQDQNLTPIGGLPGAAEIQLPDGQTITQYFSVNDEGIGKLPVMVRNLPNGCLVSIKIQVTHAICAGKQKHPSGFGIKSHPVSKRTDPVKI